MKKSLVLAMAMALGVTASAYAANPFSDVPAGHWAYDSVAKLAAAGVVDGYADGAFDGDKLMTRYEMAQIVAKAMAKGADCDKLAAEFADELDTLGVRVAKLEKGADKVKITGQIRASYDYRDGSVGKYTQDKGALRSRIWINGAVNEDWTYTAMFQNEQVFDRNDTAEEGTSFQRAFVSGRVGGLKVKAGRDNQVLMNNEILSDRADMVQASYGKDVKLTAQFGKLDDQHEKPLKDQNAGKYWAVEAATKVAGVDLKALYVDIKDQNRVSLNGEGIDNEIWGARAEYKLGDWGLHASYYQGDVENAEGDDDGYIVGLKYKGAKASAPGSYGAYAQYRDMAASAWIANGDGSVICADFQNKTDGGYKGYVIGANYTLAKNIVAKVEYFDLEAKVGSNDSDVLWSEVVFTF